MQSPHYLVRQTIDGVHTAGPTFEHYRFGPDPWGETIALARAVGIDHPDLADVAAIVSAWALST